MPGCIKLTHESPQENRLAQVATIEQQREIMRYLRNLNDWLDRDVHDRQSEIRSVTERVDFLSNLLNQVLQTRGEGEQIGADM